MVHCAIRNTRRGFDARPGRADKAPARREAGIFYYRKEALVRAGSIQNINGADKVIDYLLLHDVGFAYASFYDGVRIEWPGQKN